MYRLIPLLSGLLFGLGMAVSGMTDPVNVINFLDFSGNWDPSLAFVMGGAIAVFMPSYFLVIKQRKRALDGEEVCLPTNSVIDKKLLAGASLFGLGWGVSGICPGPALASAFYGNLSIYLFILAMIFGSLMAKKTLQ
ncbi:YeeE/YedE family protein [Vibrio maerlii]|uniref:YeeE/YedE family protein n=1 Tax=Vibrio maerlii TaxID=2231648 RepID=UPI000E3D03C1|nr:YeeE/YedE family protein [Vibrio maerlii]